MRVERNYRHAGLDCPTVLEDNRALAEQACKGAEKKSGIVFFLTLFSLMSTGILLVLQICGFWILLVVGVQAGVIMYFALAARDNITWALYFRAEIDKDLLALYERNDKSAFEEAIGFTST